MTRGRVGVLLAATALVAGIASGADARTDQPLGGARQDPAGDVQPLSGGPADPAELDRVDLVAARWSVVPGRRVSVRMRLVDVAPGQLRASYQLKARIGPVQGALFLIATRRAVLVHDGYVARRCRGSRSTIDAARDVVRFSLPVRCLPHERYSFTPMAFLEDADLGEVASDRVAVGRWIRVR